MFNTCLWDHIIIISCFYYVKFCVYRAAVLLPLQNHVKIVLIWNIERGRRSIEYKNGRCHKLEWKEILWMEMSEREHDGFHIRILRNKRFLWCWFMKKWWQCFIFRVSENPTEKMKFYFSRLSHFKCHFSSHCTEEQWN